MSLYYPQGALILNVRWEDFGTGDAVLQEVDKMPVLARTLSVEINDYTEADKFSATIDYNSFPFDPRCIRSLGVTICIEDKKGVFVGNSLDLIEPNEENIVFLGFADESSISFDDDAQTIKIEGRDFTSLLIDAKRVNTSFIPLSKPIDKIIEGLLNEQEATKDIEIVNNSGEDLPVLSDVAPDFNPVTAVKNQKRKETYWDIIQNIISRTALIAYIDRDKLIIDKPQNIYRKRNIKQFIYGGNIKNLSFSRKLGRLKDFNVKVLSLNMDSKKVLEAKIPEEATDPNIAGPRVTIPQLDKDGKKIEPPKDADFITFRIPEVTSKEELIKIGESIFEEMSRQQIEGSLKTFEMEIPEELDNISNGYKDTKPVSFNQIRNGSAINVLFSMDETQVINSSSSKAEKVKFLQRRGYPRDVAEAFASSLNRINTPFYVKSVMFELSQEDGFTMDIDFINFIDIDNALLRK
jgi:hypothetical protein